ncbi:hypothetical protein EDC01DRAFT_656393 [Geopyxis carbonaria]|nr:hypothetical protein EDC01DRAFT_656393 [Geopyxis carbonaria]
MKPQSPHVPKPAATTAYLTTLPSPRTIHTKPIGALRHPLSRAKPSQARPRQPMTRGHLSGAVWLSCVCLLAFPATVTVQQRQLGGTTVRVLYMLYMLVLISVPVVRIHAGYLERL